MTEKERKILSNPKNVKFNDLITIATKYFGQPRIKGSHHQFKKSWAGAPILNFQADGKMAKGYQVRALVLALEMIEGV